MEKVEKIKPLKGMQQVDPVNFCSLIIFWFCIKICLYGFKRPFTADNLFDAAVRF
jgi:hypothetical protein